MTLFLDSSALVKRYLGEPASAIVLREMDRDLDWTASALALAETRRAICRAALASDAEETLQHELRLDWSAFFVVGIDQELVERASQISCSNGTRTLDSLHIAAAERLPGPLTFLTFDERQAAAARSLGFTVVP